MSHERESPAPHSANRLNDALAEFRARYQTDAAPASLQANVLAQMRAARERAQGEATAKTPHAATHRSGIVRLWQHVSGRWWSAALAGSLATVVLATVTAPLWLHYFRESVEVATPFMLVSEPRSRELDVSQMVRVNVSREAMLDFGIPVPPERLGEQVKAEMLMGGQGEVLAVRFIEPEKKKRWRWQMY